MKTNEMPEPKPDLVHDAAVAMAAHLEDYLSLGPLEFMFTLGVIKAGVEKALELDRQDRWRQLTTPQEN